MAEQKSRWTWDLPVFEPRSLMERDDQRPQSPLVKKPSLSPSSLTLRTELGRQPVHVKLHKLLDQLKLVKQDNMVLRQEACDLREYSNAKLNRAARYLAVLADRIHKLGQAALQAEARIVPLLEEKKRLFNELLTSKGSIKVFCRVRPPFEVEGPSIIELPDDFSIRLDMGDDCLTSSKKHYEFDRVYGPHIGQGELFDDVRPFIQSALDGYNVSIFAYGQSCSGKTHTMEGTSQERGLYQRCFEELFDLSNMDMTSTSQYVFHVTAFELYNEQVRDLLVSNKNDTAAVRIGSQDAIANLVEENVTNPLEFSQLLKAALMKRDEDCLKATIKHLVITFHIFFTNLLTGDNVYSKLSLVDLPASDCLLVKDAHGDQVTDLLHVSKSLSALGDVLSSLTSRKETVPYDNSMLTKILADSIGGSSKTLLISHANNSRKELYEKENEVQRVKQEVLELKLSLKDSNEQCILLFNEVQKAWKVSFTLQSDLKSENALLADKLRLENEQSAQLRNQVTNLVQLEHEQKMQIKEKKLIIQNLQEKIKGIDTQLNEVLSSSDLRSESCSAGVLSSPRSVQDSVTSTSISKKLEEELAKRDALIQKLHEENEKLFDRLTEKTSSEDSQRVDT
ncbi:hypothetical protein HPP92_005632 [Vanilla planifolia]|uniref:Kinesin motor domain-containing protein n=1 Tax=Vanilla planifolia TaxID=51239 RepID=A0A835RQ35_VANPL|nr:hypothetical protein HPP92_005632 [Vanilla planifolia]